MDLTDYRAQIDSIDDQLMELFNQRMQISAKIAEYKSAHHIGTKVKSRERSILSRVSEQADEGLDGYARVLFSTLFDVSRAYQNSLNATETALSRELTEAVQNTPALFPTKGVVACQGVEGAYSQIACDKLFSFANILYFKTFEGVFQAVEKGLCEFGILPIENSSYGSVNEVYDLMRHFNFHIVRSLKLKIDHALLAKPGKQLSDIKEIFSHEQALGQCSAFLKQLGDVKITVCENTAAAAKMVSDSDREDIAAISSHECAELYGLSILSDDIQNSDSNFTRFICITKDLRIFPGSNKISLMLSLPHRPGALYAFMSKIAALGLNVSKLESRPIPGKDFEFLFYFDIDASVISPEVIHFLSDLSKEPEMFMFLGNYSEA
ncbi:bifunctional chorismate mutase/prephenate dehydratase [Yeguia hominis]|uniref:Bifunctional chorismate mutase/prephenate dehydratase n=1 Tax=Yeguia hominis TaxID=2763662 RepID=A0A926DB60_9FIRM|nr:bifunctional chorismate mutase/prephenate dehydratase [Yeguia hominis]MBC8534637.1 chorismate mutase [Yeguia hominis]